MPKILIWHMGGARANQLDEFTASGQELIAGRDPYANVRFDPETDDLVSRQHAKIRPDPVDPNVYQLVDLQSRNGTFLNHQRVYGTVRINHSDVVQLGPGGPEFRFELDPPPDLTLHPLSNSSLSGVLKPTRASFLPDPASSPTARPVGRSTVERLLGDVFSSVKREANQSLWVGIAAIALVVIVGGAAWLYVHQSHSELETTLNQAQAQDQAKMAQMNEELKKAPAALEESKRQIENLEKQLQASNNRNEANNQALLKALDAERRQAAALSRAIQMQQQQRPSGSGTGGASPGETGASDAAVAAFESGVATIRQKLDQGQASAALELATKLTKEEPNRWEGFSLAGECAQKLNDYRLASDMYQRAAVKAPNDRRRELEELARQMQFRAEK